MFPQSFWQIGLQYYWEQQPWNEEVFINKIIRYLEDTISNFVVYQRNIDEDRADFLSLEGSVKSGFAGDHTIEDLRQQQVLEGYSGADFASDSDT